MKKSKILIIIISAILSVLCICLVCINFLSKDDEKDDKPLIENKSNSVYASSEDQEKIYSLITNEETSDVFELKQYDLQIVKESITPIYSLSMAEYAKSNSLNICRESRDYCGDLYTAKMITKDGLFAGNISFGVKDGKIKRQKSSIFCTVDEFKNNTTVAASHSYADHAVRIQNILQKDSFVPVSNVRLVMIKEFGYMFFCINDNNTTTFIAAGSVTTQEKDPFDLVLSCSDLKQIGNDVVEEQKRIDELYEEWEKEHPGEILYGPSGFTCLPSIGVCSHIDNIVDIHTYLKVKSSD